MLVFSRRDGESIIVGKARIKVFDIQPGKVKLAIEAPRDIPVDRYEIWRRKREGHNAKQWNPGQKNNRGTQEPG